MGALDSTKVDYWLKHDFWTLGQAVVIFLNLNPVETYFDFEDGLMIAVDFDGNRFSVDMRDQTMPEQLQEKFKSCYMLLFNGDVELKLPPADWIERAVSKDIQPEWLDDVIEKDFYKSKQLQETYKPIAENERAHVSNSLAILNQAATRFWANADPNDNSTHPINKTVENWLIERGYSETLAKKGATIIRPEWATTGRKADK